MINVGVIRGGVSAEYDVSINTGANVLAHLRGDKLKDTYKAFDIFIDKEGLWHLNGIPASMEDIASKVDVVFNALHGDFGEDGKLQEILDLWGMPYTGSGSVASAIGYNKARAKEEFATLGIQTARHVLFPAYQKDFDGPLEEYAHTKAKKVLQTIPPPWIVKPLTSGSSMGVHVCKTYAQLVRAFEMGVNQNVSVLVEEMIEGKEATVAVIEKFRGQDAYVLPPIEIRVPKTKTFFDYEAKYTGVSEEICPGNFSETEKRELERLAALIHTGLNLSHYSRSDFIIHPKKGIFALEVNTLPGLTDESLTPKALAAVGATMPEFIHHIITLSLDTKNQE